MRNLGREVVIVEAVRTPIGRGHPEKGVHRERHPADLLGACFVELIARTGIEPQRVEDVIAGCGQPIGVQQMNIARTAWLQEGLPIETAATTIDRACGSSQQAVNFAAAQIAAGINDVVIGCGVEQMSRVTFADGAKVQALLGHAYTDKLLAQHEFVGQGMGAEMIADEYGITREHMDAFAVTSHARAHAATQAGAFRRELVPMHSEGEPLITDQGIRPDTTVETLAQLRPAFHPEGRITAGSSSQVSDGAAAVLLMARDVADELGLTPRARIVDHVAVGCDPTTMLKGPIPATRRLLERNDLTIDEIDAFECNEAFAPVVLAWAQEVGADLDRVNRRGGAIALGHPLGSSGARLLTTLLHTLEDDDLEMGIVTMCCGGGFGTGTLVQRI